MHSVRHGADPVVGKHVLRDMLVDARHPVDVMRAFQGQFRHVERLPVEDPRGGEQVGAALAEDPLDQRPMESVVPRRNRRMCREHALLAHGCKVLLRDPLRVAGREVPLQQRQPQQRRMALVHVVDVGLGVAELLEHLLPGDSENRFLAQPVALVAAVQVVRERPVPFRVGIEVGVEQVHRDDVTADAAHGVLPAPDRDIAPLDLHGGRGVHALERALGRPVRWVFHLVALDADGLAEIPLAIEQGDPDHPHA